MRARSMRTRALVQAYTRQNRTKTCGGPPKQLAAAVATGKFARMKTMLALLCSVLLLTVSSRSQTPAPKTSADEPADPATKNAAPPSKTGAKSAYDKAADKKADPAKKELKILGIEVPRGERGFLGVQIVNGTFKISFYDAKKKPMAPDVTRALLRWDPKNKVGQERVILNAGEDGTSLTSPKSIKPPYNFKLFITLLKEATETADPVGETHVIDFRA
jgi:hypothetical protein